MNSELQDRVPIREASPRHLPALDGLRGLAALSVVLGHMPEFGFAGWIPESTKNYGVVIFFSLSGFLMGHLYLQRKCTPSNAWAFLVARIARIVPIYFLVVIASFFIYHIVDHHYNVSIRELVRLLTFNGSTSVFWSVGPEFQFYVVFLGLWWMWDRHRLRNWAIGISVMLCMIGIAFNFSLPGILFLSKAHIFLFGIAASIVFHMTWSRSGLRLIQPVLQFSCIVSLVMLAFPNSWNVQIYNHLVPHWDPKMSSFYGNPMVAGWAAIVVLSLGWGGQIINGTLGSRALVFLGRISFSVYLLHDAVLWLLQQVNAGQRLGMLWASAIAILLTLGTATVANRYVEMPSGSVLRNRLSGLHLRLHPRSAC